MSDPSSCDRPARRGDRRSNPLGHAPWSWRRTGVFAGLFWAIGVQTAVAAGSEQQVVMDVTQAVCDAFRSGDLPALEGYLAPDFVLVGADSVVQPRAQAIAEVRAREPRYTVFRNHDISARVYGDAAVVQGITSLEGTAGGKAFAVDVRFTDTLIRTDGRWQAVVCHVTRIPPS